MRRSSLVIRPEQAVEQLVTERRRAGVVYGPGLEHEQQAHRLAVALAKHKEAADITSVNRRSGANVSRSLEPRSDSRELVAISDPRHFDSNGREIELRLDALGERGRAGE